jgi:hypothetical protein
MREFEDGAVSTGRQWVVHFALHAVAEPHQYLVEVHSDLQNRQSLRQQLIVGEQEIGKALGNFAKRPNIRIVGRRHTPTRI